MESFVRYIAWGKHGTIGGLVEVKADEEYRADGRLMKHIDTHLKRWWGEGWKVSREVVNYRI